MQQTPSTPEITIRKKQQGGTWVQTERKAHEAWAKLIARKPRAAELLHYLVANMGQKNAIVISQAVLAKFMGRSINTVQRSIRELETERWIQIIRIGKGKEAAYVVNDRVAWGQTRDQLRLSMFSATVVVDYDDQDTATLDQSDLRPIPALYPRERQLPTGAGEPPPIQPSLDGLAPDLPSLKA